MKAAGIDMSIKQVDQTTLINDAIFGNFQANGWRNHPGFDPDTQWVWWHCDDEPAAVNGATNVAPEGPPVNGNNCNNAVNFSKFNDSKINEAFEQARGISDEAQRTTHYETINKQFAENLWEGWGYWSLWTVPAQKNVRGILTLKLPTADSNSAVGDDAITGLAGGIDVAGIWLKK
jgi:peptide/nickel transport system substrate-binding protein